MSIFQMRGSLLFLFLDRSRLIQDFYLSLPFSYPARTLIILLRVGTTAHKSAIMLIRFVLWSYFMRSDNGRVADIVRYPMHRS